MWPALPRPTVASLRNGVTMLTSASKAISRVWIAGLSPSGTVALARFLTSSAQGLSVMAKASADRAVLEDIARVTLAVLA